jgi:hypothetical protein
MEITKSEPVDVEPVATPAQVDRPTPNVDQPTPDAPKPDRPVLRPELRAALDESWERDEAAYRYLGR